MHITDEELRRFAEQMRDQARRRKQMRAALRAVITPTLRKNGFTGTCPHFRRLGRKRCDLFTFQFDKYGDGFVIELGQCPSDWVPAPGYACTSHNKLQPMYLRPDERARLQPGPFLSREEKEKVRASMLQGVNPVNAEPSLNATARWFRYDKAEKPEDYKRIAESLAPFVEKALAIFEDFQHVQKIDQAC